MGFLEAWFGAESARFRIRALKARFRDQKAECAVIAAHIRPGDTVCDIGANKGSFTYWLSRWVGSGRVVAFEPQPELARRLGELCRVAGLDNVTVEAKAVYSHSGTQDLFLPAGHQPGASLERAAVEAESFTTVSVPLVMLDEYFDPSVKVTVLKIDVEGAELGVFKGAIRILRQHAPLLVFECENRHLTSGDVRDVFSFLTDLGYEGSFICGDQVLPIAAFDAVVHQRQEGEWFWKRKDYYNNFVFRRLLKDGRSL